MANAPKEEEKPKATGNAESLFKDGPAEGDPGVEGTATSTATGSGP